jgi:restriction system protein
VKIQTRPTRYRAYTQSCVEWDASNGTTQIDHILVSPFGLFVIETKNIKGWIFGSEQQRKWIQTLYGKKFTFQNPLHQNYRHTKCLGEYLRLDPKVVHSVVFFVGNCTFKTQMPPNVLNTGLSSHIRSYRDRLLSDRDIERIVGDIERLKGDGSLTHGAHMRSLRERHNSTTVCPKCGSALIERTARKGPNAGAKFLGCTGYPRCRYTREATT